MTTSFTDETTEWVYVVDDDLSVREALSSLIRSVGLNVETFPSAAAFLAVPRKSGAACLILDVRMPELSGLELQGLLSQAGICIPIIFVTGHGDIPMAVRAMKRGAIEFLAKPFRDEELISAIQSALTRARDEQVEAKEIGRIREHYEQLTNREKEVIAYIVQGYLNKQVAAELGISETTIKVHRHNIMAKMKVRTLPDLVRMMEKLGAQDAEPGA